MEFSTFRRTSVVGLFAVALLWLGLLIGVAFLATPVKFLAPSLKMAVALDVGRHTFAAFSKVEWLCAAALLLALIGGSTRLGVTMAAILVVALAAQTAWLLPLLDARVATIIAGRQPTPSNLHWFYIALDTTKLVALLVICGEMARLLLRPWPGHANG